jgi:hypothetical protein
LGTAAVTWGVLHMKPLSATNMESVFPCSSTYLISFNSMTVPTWSFWVDLVCSDSISQHINRLSLEILTRLFWKSYSLCKERRLPYICYLVLYPWIFVCGSQHLHVKKNVGSLILFAVPVHETLTVR